MSYLYGALAVVATFGALVALSPGRLLVSPVEGGEPVRDGAAFLAALAVGLLVVLAS